MISTHVYRRPWHVAQREYLRRPHQPSWSLQWLFDRATEQYVVLGTVDANSPFVGVTPTLVSGDLWVLAQNTTPNTLALTPLTDGTASYSGSASRQSWLNKLYDTSLGAYYPTDEAGDYFTIYVNNQAPTEIAPIADQQAWTNVLWEGPILDDAIDDAEGDPITWDAALGDTLPTGVSVQTVVLNSGQPNERTVQRLRGTPAAGQEDVYNLVLRGTDIAGASVTLTAFDLTVGVGVLVPTVDTGSTSLATALSSFSTAGLSLVDIVPEINGATVGNVFDQSPAGGTYVAPGTPAVLYVSGVATPDVDDPGTSQATAQNAITAAGLTASVVTAYSATIPAGEVSNQLPQAGEIVAPGHIVTITVSAGDFPVSQDSGKDMGMGIRIGL